MILDQRFRLAVQAQVLSVTSRSHLSAVAGPWAFPL